MIEEHWTKNEDLLEEYLLGRVDLAQRQAMQDHLTSCDECRVRLESEEEIIAAVRHAGARATKQELQSAIKESKGIPWPHILSMAAVLFILLGIGVYNRWFMGPTVPAGMPLENRNDTTVADPSSPIDDEQKEEGIAQHSKDDAGLARENEQNGEPSAPGASSAMGGYRSEPDTFLGFLMEGKAGEGLADQRKAMSESADAMKPIAKQRASSQPFGRKGNLLVFVHEPQSRLQTANSSEVPFTLEQVDSLFHLNLFLLPDQRTEDSVIEVEMPSPDSLLVRFGQTLVGIQIPIDFRGKIAK